jgi:nucleoside-diphosphate-sugar epimerase
MKIVVCGASGYVGRALLKDLVKKGFEVVGVSRRHHGVDGASFRPANLLNYAECAYAVGDADFVYNLAANVGGIGFITENKADCMASAAININLLRAMSDDVKGYFFASSSCVYPSLPRPLTENDVFPAYLNGYGLEKYFSEQTALEFGKSKGIPVRIARLHTVYGPGDIRGGIKDHFPTALTLKVIDAKLNGLPGIKVWGDGSQTRSLLYIDDAVEGIQKIMNRGVPVPLNLASSEKVSVNGILDMLDDISAVKLDRYYDLNASTGCQHKTSDNTLLREHLSWEPMTSARSGIERLYLSCWEHRTIRK